MLLFKDHERREEEERIRTENLLKGNPLLNQNKSGSNFSVKRRYILTAAQAMITMGIAKTPWQPQHAGILKGNTDNI